MALLVLINYNFKFFFTMPCLTFDKDTPAFCIRSVLYFLFMPTEGAFYFLFIYCSPPPPAIAINAFFISSKASLSSFSETFLACLFLQSFLILCSCFEKYFSTSGSSSDLIETILPNAVLESIPASNEENSLHFIPFRSRDKRIPYCD